MLLASALPAPAAPAAQALAPTIAPPTSAPTADPQADAAYGRALFLAKGCDRCHHHAAIAVGRLRRHGRRPISTYRWDADHCAAG
jgi:mono/diheme cytochrome c family protein